MKAPALSDILNLRKPVSHVVFLIFSFLVAVIAALTGKYPDLPLFSFSLFFMLFAQLEVFIYIGHRLFAQLNFDKSPGEITRVVIIRFTFFIVTCLLISMILFIIVMYAGLWIRGGDTSKVIYYFIHNEFHGWFKSTLSGLSLGAIIFIVILWQTSLRREQKLREENLIFQNETLKNQVNPHFLFNSLNTLSAMVSGTQPELAEEFINRLSSIYRYILENSSKDKVPLSLELSFITDYFFLLKIRDENKIQMTVAVKNPEMYEILPVSLQILVENAIKHNMATRENPLNISIYIEDKHVIVKNNLQKMAVQLASTKIGLRNLAERVRLITGKVLIIEETGSDFIVKIPLL